MANTFEIVVAIARLRGVVHVNGLLELIDSARRSKGENHEASYFDARWQAARPSILPAGKCDVDSVRASVNLSETFIRRPIATSLIMLAIAVFGVLAYRALPVSDLPNVDFPTISVNAALPGADPGTMASSVASPLERQFTSIAGLDDMTSASSPGTSNVTLQFALDRDIDGATVDVQTQIAAAMRLLPPGLTAPPSFRKSNPADASIMIIGLLSNTLPLSTLDDYLEHGARAADRRRQRRGSRPGFGAAEIRGARPG